jgi:hypothetical protein
MAKAKIHTIKPGLNLVQLSEADLLQTLNKVHDGILNNPAYPTPPVDLAAFKTAIDAYTAAVSAAIDGGKKATAARDKARSDVMLMLRLLGHYVEANCKNDMPTFLSSGFSVAAPRPKTPPQPVAVPSIVSVDQGNAGELKVTIKPVKKAKSYEIRYAAAPAAGGTPTWTSLQVSGTKPPPAISNLTRGTDYTFQVRAFGKLGFSDWSSPVDKMCT